MKHRHIRVLVLEDNSSDAQLLLHVLKRAGLVVEHDIVWRAEDFKQSLAANRYDLVLGDFRLPGWTGADALQWMRASGCDLPFILVTSALGDEQAAACIKDGAADYILKDRLERLPAAIVHVLEERKLCNERDLALKKLRESEQQYRLMFEANPNPMWVFNIETMKFLAVNEASVHHYGYTQKEFLSMSLQEMRLDEDIPTFLSEYHRWTEPHVYRIGIKRHRKKDGTMIWVDLTARDIRFQDQNARMVLIRDVTAQLQAEAGLLRSEAQYRSIIEGAPYGIYRKQADGKLLLANPALVAMLGYESEEEILRLPVSSVFYENPEDRKELLTRAENQEIVPYATKWKRKDGRLLDVRILARKLKAHSGDQAAYEVFVEDITEQRMLEEQFLQAQKMEAVGQLAGGVAHDFNNLLMVISGNAQLLVEQRANPSKVEHHALQISKATGKAASVARQLLVFTRKHVMERVSVDLNSVIIDLWKMLPRLLGEDIEMTPMLDPSVGAIYADQGQIEQIIMNLAVNARDAMPDGGKLIIRTANVDMEGTAIIASAGLKAGHYAMLAVKDTGVGMSQETQARIFEPFFTTKERHKGTGLGLATVYGIVKHTGGCIHVESEPGKGTIFKIYLPLAEQSITSIAPQVQEVAPPGSETVLLVEDDEMLRELVSEYLRSKDYKLLVATNGYEALNICHQHDGAVDLLLTDVVMPGMDGQDLAKNARKLNRDMRVIFVSGYQDREMDEEALDASTLFLQKPFSLNSLAQKIREVFGEER